MAKQLNVSLAFQADTSKAKAQIEELSNSLKKVATSLPNLRNNFDTSVIKDASNAAMELEQHLRKATDVNTGKLNLATFQASLKASNTTLDQLRQRLEKIGPDGQEAFMQVSQAIAYAENPIKRVNKALDTFKTTLMNTARWQISSSILHGFMGAIQEAYGYAQDLNKSLNNIRIVTGYDTEKMAEFAVQANKAAQALSTRTTDYTDAALIYYQQGIRDQAQIEARTATTIKLANVSRQSAEDVSSQMTAIWNNFDTGRKSLEYYADAITALGASTASSSEEIATGLEKFAAVSKTVGLSYEYATAALATVVAQTRQSADTVGTAFRTIFSRLEGLKLGETLEDGVDLNKYSKALRSVGVDILDATGNLKNMDNILDETAAHWDTLTQAQKVAFAQTVGGVRQYTNLIALMDNWDKMQANITTAKTSEGTLQKQADIYAESWEASQKRVKAALEEIYDKLLNDDFFISLNNALTTTIKIVSGVIDSFGGLKGMLLSVAGIFMTHFSAEVPRLLSKVKEDIAIITGQAQKQAAALQEANAASLTTEANTAYKGAIGGTDTYNMAYAAEAQGLATIAKRKAELNANSAKYSKDELTRAENEIARLELQQKRLIEVGKKYDDLNKKTHELSDSLQNQNIPMIDKIEQLGRQAGTFETVGKGLDSILNQSTEASIPLEEMKNQMLDFAEILVNVDPVAFKDLKGEIENFDLTRGRDELENLCAKLDAAAVEAGKSAQEMLNFETSEIQIGNETPKTQEQIRQLAKTAKATGQAFVEGAIGIKTFDDMSSPLPKHGAKISETIMTFSAALMQANAVINSVKRLSDVFSDEDASTIDKISAVIGVLTTGIMLFNTVSSLTAKIQSQNIGLSLVHAGAKLAESGATATATTVQIAFNGAMYACPAVWFAAAIIAAVAAIGLLVAALCGAFDAESEQEKSMKNTAKAAEELAQAYEETKQAYEDLKDAIEEHDNALTAIEEMEKGTLEWRDAIREANDQALELIDTLGLTKDAYEIDADGIIRFKEGVMEAAVEEQSAAAARAQASSIMANQMAREAKATAELQSIMDSQHKSVVGGVAKGMALGGFFGPLGVALGGQIGGIKTRIDNAESDKKINEAVQRLTSGDLAAQFAKHEFTDELLKEKLNIDDDDLIESIKDLADTINKNTEQQEISSELAARSILETNKNVRESGYADDIAKAAGRIYQDAYYDQDVYNKYLTDAKSRGWFASGNDASKAAMAEYAKVAGLDQLKDYEVKDYLKNGSIEYTYIDDEGKKQERTVTAEEIAAKLASAEAEKRLNEATEALLNTFTNLDQSGQDYDQVMKQFLASEDLSGAKKKDYNSLLTQVSQSEGAANYLTEQATRMGFANLEEYAKALGYESATAFTEAFQKELNDTSNQWRELNLDNVDLKGIDNITLETGKKLKETFDKINLGPKGKEAGEEFVKNLNEMLDGLDPDDQSTALGALVNIDWSSWDALDQAASIMQQFGKDIDVSKMQEFADNMRIAAGAAPDFSQLKSNLIAISGVLSKLNFGSIISDEDYQKLVDYNNQWKQFFQMQADGTRKFIGDSEEMTKATQDSIREQHQKLKERAAAQKGFNDTGWGWADENGQWHLTDWDTVSGSNIGAAEVLMNAGGGTEAALNQLGYTDEVIQTLITKAKSDSADIAEEGTNQLREMYKRIAEFQKENLQELDEDFYEMMASTAQSIEDLDALLKSGDITQAAYNKQFHVLGMQAASNATDFEELDEAIKKYKLSENDVKDKTHELALAEVEKAETTERLIELQNKYGLTDKEIANKRQELITSQIDEAQTLDELVEVYKKYNLTTDDVGEKALEFATNLATLNNVYDKGVIGLNQYNQKIQEFIDEVVNNSSSLDELKLGLGQFGGTENFGETNTKYYDEYAQGLLHIAEQYSSCTNAAAEYEDALSSLNNATGANYESIVAQIKAVEEHLEVSIRAEEAAKKHGLTLDTLNAQMKEIAKEEGVTEKTALAIAIANERMNRGVAALVNNWEDWRKILTTTDKTAEDYAATLDDLSEAVTELVGWYEDLALDSEFVEKNMELIDKSATGDVTAILELGAAVAQLAIASADLDATLAAGRMADTSEENAFQQWADSAKTAEENFESLQGSLESTFANLQAHMAELRENPDLLESLVGEGGLEEFVAQLNAYAAATGMTATQMQEMLSSVGVTANVQSDYQEKEVQVPQYREEVTAVNYKRLTGTRETPDGDTVETTVTVPEYTKASVPMEPLTTTGFVEVASISMDKNGEAPKIPPPQFTGKKAPSKTALSGGTGNKPGSSKSTKGSTSKKETKEHKNLTDEKERYHIINKQIERQSNLLDRLSKNKDRAFGPEKQKWYAKELKSLKDMGKMYEEHLRQSTEYLAQDKAAIQAWGARISDKDGTILNYDALLAAQIAAYNKAVDKYNASAQTDADKDALKAAEDAYSKFLEDLKQYEETVKQHEEDINNYVDNMIEQYDTMQAKTADAIEFRIEYDDSVLDFLDKLIDRLDSWNGSMFAAVDIMGKLNEKTGALIDKNKDLETATAETLEHFLMDYKEFDDKGNIIYQTGMSKSASDAFIGRFNEGTLTDEDVQMLAHMPEEERQLLMDYAQQRQDNTDALIETAQAVVDDVERQFNDAKDELAEAAKPIASAAAAMDNYAAIMDIVGADYLGVTDDIMQRFRDQQWNVLHETTMANKATMESLAAQRDMINEEMNKALEDGNMELVEMYREKLKGINDEVQSATEAWYQSWQAELSKLTEDFEKHIDEIKNKALDLAAGDAGTWQSLKDTMAYAQEAAERFLPEYKEIYEFSKLNRDINKSIDDTDNIKNKQALKKLQEEINKLQEKSGQISQYDLDNARRKYELELARLALEESRNAKDMVRLSKDSEGNWSYIYTASEEDVAAAEQNYEDKLYAMQKANADYIDDLQNQLVQATEDYYNKVAEINLIYKDDDEKRREELEKARMQYEETMGYYSGELQKAMDNNKELYDEDWAWYSDYTQKINDDQGYRLGELDNYVTEFDDTMLGMATGYDSVMAFEDDLLDHSIDTLDQMDEAYEHWSEQIHFSMEEAGTSVEYFAEDMMSQVDDVIVPKAEEARDTVEELGEIVVDIMADMVDAADQWRVSYSAAMDAIIAKNNAVTQSIRQVMSALSALKTAEIGHDTTTGTAPEGSKVSTKTTTTPTQTQGTGGGGTSSPSQPQKSTDPDAGLTNSQKCAKYGHKWDEWKYDTIVNGYKIYRRKCMRCGAEDQKSELVSGRGCFAAGTKIMLPNRQLKNIEEVQLGEEILAYNIETEQFENKVVNMIYFKQDYNQIATIDLSNGEQLVMTLGHPLLTTNGWKSLDLENSISEHGVLNISLLNIGDILIGYNELITVNDINISSVDNNYIVYCLGVDGYHNFIANNIIVHNAAMAQVAKMASGGYTGDFGNPTEGKLAVLHSKELVLNQDDTKNMLSAIDMVRSISKTIDAYAMTNQFTIGNLTAARGINPISNQMEQSVTITAEFPNATDRNEIAEAFTTLINQASQYANRKY